MFPASDRSRLALVSMLRRVLRCRAVRPRDVTDDGAVSFAPVSSADVDALRSFLRAVDLTLAGLDEPAVTIWLDRDADSEIIGSTGFELSNDRQHALIRSVAVAPGHRAAGAGSRLARYAMDQARSMGATRAWLFSRRSGPFWQQLGFANADKYELAAALPETHQVRLFVESGQLEREVAWSRPLGEDARRGIRMRPAFEL
jgi:N-acetylglutamate synthase-like GNAT family acetyltransferase